jgi:Cu+-exporting ATPase
MNVKTDTEVRCTHCGDVCPPGSIQSKPEQAVFCCDGCRTVYQLLQENGLGHYYELDQFPGLNLSKTRDTEKFAFLDNPEIANSLISFNEGGVLKVGLFIPAIHCSSCIWLLENLNLIHPAIKWARVDFMKKEISISADPEQISLRQLVELLSDIGYEPDLSLERAEKKQNSKEQHRLIKQIALAGFCFGNIMMFSFPEYFGFGNTIEDEQFSLLFKSLNLILAIPALLYSGRDYLTSAWKAVRKKVVHINIPLALGMLALFGRSVYEILSGAGAGYMDSLTGLIFFLLVGKWFQEYTYGHIRFERDYKSYFPLAVSVIQDGELHSRMVSSLEKGDRMYIRNGEIIPADAILLSGKAQIDYSFVTGESELVQKSLGELIYGGGRQIGEAIEAEVIRDVSKGHLTKLWNSGMVTVNEGRVQSFSDAVSRYFTWALLAIAGLSFLIWSFYDLSKAFFVFTSVLIVACPCALALSSPFALGNMMRILGRNGFYLKNTQALEDMSHIDHIAFDKTGTLSLSNQFGIDYEGKPLNQEIKAMLYAGSRQSKHPYSRAVADWCALTSSDLKGELTFTEYIGKGIGISNEEHHLRLGSAQWLNAASGQREKGVHLEVDGTYAGFFKLTPRFRPHSKETLTRLGESMEMSLISGDNASEMPEVQKLYPAFNELQFKASPEDKLQYVKRLQEQGKNVMMMGDGLNDSGALMQAELGVVITEDVNNFTPAANAILSGEKFEQLPVFFKLSKKTLRIIHLSFAISLAYNMAGLSWAISGQLSPVFAAILMPLSSISVVLFNTAATRIVAKKEGLQ